MSPHSCVWLNWNKSGKKWRFNLLRPRRVSRLFCQNHLSIQPHYLFSKVKEENEERKKDVSCALLQFWHLGADKKNHRKITVRVTERHREREGGRERQRERETKREREREKERERERTGRTLCFICSQWQRAHGLCGVTHCRPFTDTHTHIHTFELLYLWGPSLK